MTKTRSSKTYRVATLGCRTNQYESQAYQDQLDQMGYRPAEEGEEAEICIVNTCTVTASADSRSRHAIRSLARHNPKSRLVVTGCSVERQREAIVQIGGVTDVVPNQEKEQLLNRLFDEEELPEFSIRTFEGHTRAFVKVQDGCNSFCTYCVIPYVRGRSRSRALPEIVQEVKQLIGSGYKEVVITGINVGDYDGDGQDVSLAQLMREVDQVEGLERLRLSSIDPDEVDDALLDTVIEGRTTCKSMHIVLQSGSNSILKRMNRKYTRQMFFDAVAKLKEACPDFTVTTDIIVGFPGESEADFEETLDAVRRVQFAKVHVFPYSERPRTRAALYEDKVAPEVIADRKQRLLRESEKQGLALREQYVGRRMMVLTEGQQDQEGRQFGHTDNFLGVWIEGAALQPNQLVEVELLSNGPEGLFGEVVSC